MIDYKFPDGLEVKGSSLMPWFDNLDADVTAPMLAKRGLSAEKIVPDGWYDAQIFEDIHNELFKAGGAQTFVAIGKATAEALIDPASIPSMAWFLEEGFSSIFTASFRNIPDDYGIKHRKLETHHYEVINQTSTPDNMIYGFLWGVLVKMDVNSFNLRPLKGYIHGELSIGATFTVSW